eukprot:6176063-Pleurochrysis_carterae.AAC.1
MHALFKRMRKERGRCLECHLSIAIFSRHDANAHERLPKSVTRTCSAECGVSRYRVRAAPGKVAPRHACLWVRTGLCRTRNGRRSPLRRKSRAAFAELCLVPVSLHRSEEP